MQRNRIKFIAVIVVFLIGLVAILHFQTQGYADRQTLIVQDGRQVNLDIYQQNQSILDEARSHGVLSPYLDVRRITMPIEGLRATARQEAQNLGLQGEPSAENEYFLTKGQWFTIVGVGVTESALPDRYAPAYLARYRGQVNSLEVADADYIEILIDAETGIPFSRSVGPSRGEYAVDVTEADIGYPVIDIALTPQAPLPLPDAPND